VAQIILVLSQSWEWCCSLVWLAQGALAGRPSFDAFIGTLRGAQPCAVYGVPRPYWNCLSHRSASRGWIVHAWNFKTMLVIAALLYFAATIIRVIMARASAKPT